METHRWTDIRDWTAFAAGVGVPVIGGVVAVSADVSKAASSVQTTIYVLTTLTLVFAFIGASVWVRFRDYRRRLGIVDIKSREKSPPIHTLYQGLQRSYRWHGISAVNELVGNTEVQAAINQKTQRGVRFTFTLSDERDWLRMREQVLWEHEPTRDVAIVQKNIASSKEVLNRFNRSAHVTLLNYARTPCFRVVEIDDHRLEVAHYDRGGCGFSGTYLVLEKRTNDPNDNILYEWFHRAGDVDRKNAVIDHLYNRITGMMLAGFADGELLQIVLKGDAFEKCRGLFSEQFGWQLEESDIQAVIQYLHDRYASNGRS